MWKDVYNLNRKILSVIGVIGLFFSGVLATMALYSAIIQDGLSIILYLAVYFITALISLILIAIGGKNDDIWWEE